MKWEYKMIRFDQPVTKRKVEEFANTSEQFLNAAGADGWELVAAVQTAGLGATNSVLAFFKRPQK